MQQTLGISKLYSIKFIENLLNELIIELKDNKKVKIHNFGTFNLLDKKERVGRNPKNNKKHIISRRKVISFKIAKILKKKINNEKL